MKKSSISKIIFLIFVFTTRSVISGTFFRLVKSSADSKAEHDGSFIMNKAFFMCSRNSDCTNVVRIGEQMIYETVHGKDDLNAIDAIQDVIAVWEKFHGEVSNIALGKPAVLSSIYEGNSSGSYAVDGKTNAALKECAQTDIEAKAWLRINLEREALVTYVHVFSFAGKRAMKAFDIKVGNNHDNGGRGNPACVQGALIPDSVIDLRAICPSNMIGQYVTLNVQGLDYLEVCELEVFGYFLL